jgi:hypothetical protein
MFCNFKIFSTFLTWVPLFLLVTGAEAQPLLPCPILPGPNHEIPPAIAQLRERGIKRVNGEVTYRSPEVIRLFTDPVYRNVTYAIPRTKRKADSLWCAGQTLLALYLYADAFDREPAGILASLYATNVKKEILAEGVINSFYTYGWFEPSVVSFPNGKFQIDNPNYVEDMLRKCNMLSQALLAFAAIKPLPSK